MINKRKKRWPLVVVIGVCLLSIPSAYPQKDKKGPITKEGFFKAVEKKLTDYGARYLIGLIKDRGVSFVLSDSDKEKVRSLQRGLGEKRINDLIAALKSSYRPVVQPQPTQPTTSATLTTTATPREHIHLLVLQPFDFVVVTVDAKGKVTERRKGQAQYFVEDLGGGVTLDMVEIPGGSFWMGSSNSEVQQALADANLNPDADKDMFNNEKPQHRVNVPKFFIGKFEVTQAQWRAVARMPQVKVHLDEDPSASAETDSYPVEQVKWVEAEEFCERLSRYTGQSYRLPTEAEWEYACRAGTTTPFAFGETITPDLVNYESDRPYGAASKRTYRGGTTPVGSTRVANGFGLYDMHGNVKEWCLDGWHEDYDGAPLDGNAWWSESSALRVARGGSWLSDAFECRCAFRDGVPMKKPRTNVGFRVVMETQP